MQVVVRVIGEATTVVKTNRVRSKEEVDTVRGGVIKKCKRRGRARECEKETMCLVCIMK